MLLKKAKNTIRENRNGLCVMMEGMFNQLGLDIIDMTTIIPLFLSFLGANLQTIGALTTMRSVLAAAVPLICGNIVAATRSKRNFSIIFNGTSRLGLLLISVALFLGLPNEQMLIFAFLAIAYFSWCQPMTGLAWSHLIGAHMPPERRSTMLGILYSVSGVLIFFSSGIIKAIRSNEALSESLQYAWIFLIGGFFVATSVLWYLPMQDSGPGEAKAAPAKGKEYFQELANCFRNKKFRQIIYLNLLFNVTTTINTFYFIFVQDTLKLSHQNISDLIIVQTFGVMVGGFLTGWISQRFSVKRMLQLLQVLGTIVPLAGLWALSGSAPMLCSAMAIFCIGFMKGGQIGYTSYILEIIPNEKTVYHVVARSLALIPVSFAGILIGDMVARFGNTPVFILQVVLCLAACFFASRLELHVFRKEQA